MIGVRRAVAIAVLWGLAIALLTASPLWANPNSYRSYRFLPSPAYKQSDVKASLEITGDAFGLPLTEVEWRDPSGGYASCRPLLGGCVIRNTYSSTGVLVAVTHEFLIAGQGRRSGTYLAIARYCTHTVGAGCWGDWAELFRANFTIDGGSVGASAVYLPRLIR